MQKVETIWMRGRQKWMEKIRNGDEEDFRERELLSAN